MKNAFGRLISKLNTAEERLSELEDRSADTTQTETGWEKKSETKWNKKTRTEHPRANICVIWMPEVEEIQIDTHSQAQIWSIIFKLLKTTDKENIMKASRGKRQTTYKEQRRTKNKEEL